MKKSIFLLSIFFLCFLSSCEIINPKEELPFYLKIEQPKVSIDPTYTSDLGVRYVFLTRGNEEMGFFEVPCVVPIYPNTSIKSFLFQGGFNQVISGLNAQNGAATYPFWKGNVVNIDVPALDTFVYRPTFSYYSDTIIERRFYENFEDASMKFVMTNPTNSNAVPFSLTTSEKHQGTAAGMAIFDSTHFELSVSSKDNLFGLPFAGITPMYLEITYKSDIPFTLGLVSRDNSSGNDTELPWNVYLKSPTEWKTVYVRLNELVQQVGAVIDNDYCLFIKANGKDENGKAQSGKLLIDNVRVFIRKT